MVGARHQEEILPDVFANTSSTPSGEVVFKVGDSERVAVLGQPTDPDLKRIAFYDEHCGDSYLTTEAEISYRPSAVKLLEDLAAVCIGVSQAFDSWKREKSYSGSLPKVNPGGSADVFLRGLNASTTDDDIKAATQCPFDIDEQLEAQKSITARLRVNNPTQEKARLIETSNALTMIANYLETLEAKTGEQAEKRFAVLVEKVESARKAADLASQRTFGNDPLPEVGSNVWKVLWDAAESYSNVVYPNHSFPNTSDGAVCVLCQQQLDADATDRLVRFQQFVVDMTAEEARRAQHQVDEARGELKKWSNTPANISEAVIKLELKEYPNAQKLRSILEALQTRALALVAGKSADSVEVTTTVATLRRDATTHRNQADGVNSEGFAKNLAEAEAQERRLHDQIAMRDGRKLIEDELKRLQAVDKFEKKQAETNTRSITMKVGELTRTYVTEEADEFFTREAQNLGLEQVRFKATKARQGSQLHKADLQGARTGTKLTDVLSEGEQTSLGFVGFLTEAHFDASKSALIFDDPVSSLDHMKRNLVARRIVELAKDRQVVVFTHDVAFTMLLHKAAKECNVSYAMRGIEKRRKTDPGYTTTSHPWKAKNAAQRIDTFKKEVDVLRCNEAGMSEEAYQRETENIAGHMSQTWERIISQVIAEPLVDYESLEVRVGKLRIIGRVTEEDVKTYDDSYSRISGWASRHDPHPTLNYSPPTVDELTNEYEVIKAWYDRVRKYQRP